MTDRSEEDVKVEESEQEALVKAPNRPTDLCHTHLRWLTGTDASLEASQLTHQRHNYSSKQPTCE